MYGLNILTYLHNKERIDAENHQRANDPSHRALREAEEALDAAIKRGQESLAAALNDVMNASNTPTTHADDVTDHLLVLPYSDTENRILAASPAARAVFNNLFQPGTFQRQGLYYIVPRELTDHVVGLVAAVL